MRSPHVAVPLILFAIAPSVARGAEVDLTLGGSLQYESNVFRTVNDPQSDFGIRLSPTVRLVDEEDTYQYDFSYRADFEQFIERTTADDVNHYFAGDFEMLLTPRLSVAARDRFRLTNDLSTQFIADDPTTDNVDESGATNFRRRDLQNDLFLSLQYALNNRINSSVNLGHQYFKPEGFNRTEANTLFGSADTTYRLDRKSRVGGGGSATFQFFAEQPGIAASRSEIYEVFGIASYEFTSDTNLSMRGGPTFIVSSQEATSSSFPNAQVYPAIPFGGGVISIPNVSTPEALAQCTRSRVLGLAVYVPSNCEFSNPTGPPNQTVVAINAANATGQTLSFDPAIQSAPPALSDTRLTFFATVSLNHRWSDNIRSGLIYRRSQSDTAGFEGTSIRDRVTFRTNWQVNDKLGFAFRVAWKTRTSATTQNQTFAVIATEQVPAGGVEVVRFTGDLVSLGIDRVVDQSEWTVNILGDRRLTRRLHATLDFEYFWLQNNRASQDAADNFRINLGIRYNFDRIRVWH